MQTVVSSNQTKATSWPGYVDSTRLQPLVLPTVSAVTGADDTSQKYLLKLNESEGAHLSTRLGNLAFLRLLPLLKSGCRVTDIGSGDGFYAHLFRKAGFDVCEIDSRTGVPYERVMWAPREAVWCCHTLEHMRNPGAVLDRMRSELNIGGWLCIVVPPMKQEIVGGHVSLWNAGLLLYHLVLAGFDCRQAMVKSWGYNVAVIVRATKRIKLTGLVHDIGDIAIVSQYFPVPFEHGHDGRIDKANWQ